MSSTLEPADELLSLAEAGRILGVTAMTVHRMVVAGVVARADQQPLKNRQVIRSSVERVATEWGRRISTGAAASMLGIGQDKLREFVRSGVLTRHRYGPNPIALDQVQLLIDAAVLTDPIHRGRIPTRQAAKELGLDRSTVSHLAQAGRIPATRDQNGRWWFDPQHLEIHRRARAAKASRRPVPAPGERDSGQ